MRLAAAMGRLDVDAMLEELTPQQFAEWWALQVVDGWGGEWERAGTIAAEAHNAGLRFVAAMGGNVSESQVRAAEDFIPGGKPAKAEHLTGSQSEQAAARRYG